MVSLAVDGVSVRTFWVAVATVSLVLETKGSDEGRSVVDREVEAIDGTYDCAEVDLDVDR